MRWLAVSVKLLISALILFYVFDRFGHSDLLEDLGKTSFAALILVGTIQVMQILIGGWRMRWIVHELREKLDWVFSVRLTLVGFFFSQTFISLLGGDGMRIWQMVRNGFSLRTAGQAVMADRILGFVMLLAIIFMGMPVAVLLTEGNLRIVMVLISVASLIGCGTFFLSYLVPRKLRTARFVETIVDQAVFCRGLLARVVKTIGAFAVPHVLNTAILYVFLADYGGEIAMGTLLVLFPPIMLLSALPISFAGWGVREGALVTVLGSVGGEAHIVLAASIAFGVSHIVASSPGSILWFGGSSRAGVEKNPHGST